MNIRDRTQQEADALATIGHPAVLQRFILNVGTECRAAPLPANVKRERAKECFRNATHLHLARPDLRYVEGFGYCDRLPLLIHHAWCVDAENNVVDPTWDEPETRQYFGFIFPPSFNLGHEVVKQKFYGLLSASHIINAKLMARFDPEIKKMLDKQIKRR